MSKRVDVYNDNVCFYCEGCKDYHVVNIDTDVPKGWPIWKFNNDLQKPTLSPSILIAKDHPERRCHSFVRDGKIQYLNDCHHDLKGQTVPLQEVGDVIHRPEHNIWEEDDEV